MTVIDIAVRNPCTVSPGDPVDRCIWIMEEMRVRHLPVVEAGRLLGMVSDRDIKDAVGDTVPLERRGDLAGTALPTGPRTAGEMMTRPPITVVPETSIAAAARIMVGEKIGALPVVRDEVLLGLVTESDMLRAYVEKGWEVDQDANLVTTRGDAAYVMDWMNDRPHTVEPAATVDQACRRMREMHIRHLPVVEAERLVGIVSDRDLRRALGRQAVTAGAERLLGCDRPVREVMSGSPCTIDISGLLDEAARRMVNGKISALPVMEGGRLAGIITETDILDALSAIRA